MPERVSLFIDYQNVYQRARDVFHGGDGHYVLGQVSPRRLGEHLCARMPAGSPETERELQAVHVYRGMPPLGNRGHTPSQRQHEAWRRDGVRVRTRPLSARRGTLEEKGIDVELALDFFAGAIDGDFDVGIIFSEDTDLTPAIEKVLDPQRGLNVVVEVAVWWNPPAQSHPLGTALGVWCHRLAQQDYEAVRDRRSYMASWRRRRP